MKTLGLIGGMSWESTIVYYQLLNRMAREKLGGLHSAKLLMWSYDFAEIESLQAAGDWESATRSMIDVAQKLEAAGSDCIVICTNTMHKMAPDVDAAVNVPLIHIADATATAIKNTPAKRPLLLATGYTMEQDFYKGRLKDMHQIDVVTPDKEDRQIVHDIIYNELCQGMIQPESKQAYLDIIARCQQDGADSVIFGCTEVGLLIRPEDFSVPVFDTTELHAEAAIEFAI
ncbi:MAG: aspartate/glutamate racemase family protein [Gammaproteobacteria bacterium]|nr:aspartate/glutamate racemase family protein [Gammaproteobacteria bacterium]